MTGPSFGLTPRHPNRRAPVRVSTESGESIEEPTDAQIDAMVAALDAASSFLIVERVHLVSDEYYIQTQVDLDHAFVVEYRDGDAEHHYAANLPPGSAAEVAAVIRHWIADDGAWRTALPWARVTFET
jgi:enamine deaminase RidA (YjgF/YER057c/UK114 family)